MQRRPCVYRPIVGLLPQRSRVCGTLGAWRDRKGTSPRGRCGPFDSGPIKQEPRILKGHSASQVKSPKIPFAGANR
eukprot:scaffold28390_cov109-Isochrysis_galbana.AAC.6